MTEKYTKAWGYFCNWFDEWQEENVQESISFFEAPFEFQQGLFLKFLDEQGLLIGITVTKTAGYIFPCHQAYVYQKKPLRKHFCQYHKTRTEATQTAIEHAFKVLEESL